MQNLHLSLLSCNIICFSCSTDINIFSHPHYDTYHDIAQVHWHAFKVPDINQLSIKCSIEICTDIPDTISGLTSCDSIPSVGHFNLLSKILTVF